MSALDHHIDKSTWPDGPWNAEPDRLEWRMSEQPGYPLLIVRNDHGALCGYVGVPPGHPAHGNKWNGEVALQLEVHGGITYGDGCSGRICHVPKPGEPDDVWWLGFDCGHAFDYMPGIKALVGTLPGYDKPPPYTDPPPGSWTERYRDIDYVRAEVEALAKQLAALA